MAKRPKGEQVKVFAENGSRVLHFTTLERAALHERAGAWRPDFCQITGRLLGYRIVGIELRRVDMDLRSMHTTAALTKSDIETVAGCRGRSHTIGLREDDRAARIKNGRPPEDRIERRIATFRVYKKVGAAKGDILRAWPK
ncbi:MAG TPA: hypothetical protein VKB47_08700 [Terracidiphilus sp.]|nr:hypothetical protein [Terracidiphilus sp.]